MTFKWIFDGSERGDEGGICAEGGARVLRIPIYLHTNRFTRQGFAWMILLKFRETLEEFCFSLIMKRTSEQKSLI